VFWKCVEYFNKFKGAQYSAIAGDTATATDDNTSIDMLAEEGSMDDSSLKYDIIHYM